MYSCVHHYGGGVAVYFVGLALVSKFIIENCLISIFLFIYSENYWAYINERPEVVSINFEKLSHQKKRAIQKSIFFPGLRRNQTGSIRVESPSSARPEFRAEPASMDAKEAEAFRQFANAVKFTRTVRQRRKNGRSIAANDKADNIGPRASIFQGEFDEQFRKSTTTRRVRNPRESQLIDEFRKEAGEKKHGSIDLTNSSPKNQKLPSLASQNTLFGNKGGLYHVTARLKANAVAPTCTGQ